MELNTYQLICERASNHEVTPIKAFKLTLNCCIHENRKQFLSPRGPLTASEALALTALKDRGQSVLKMWNLTEVSGNISHHAKAFYC